MWHLGEQYVYEWYALDILLSDHVAMSFFRLSYSTYSLAIVGHTCSSLTIDMYSYV